MRLPHAFRECLEAGPGILVAQHADAREGVGSPAERDDPGESTACETVSEMNFDVLHLRKRHLELRAVRQHSWEAESKCTIESITGAAGDDDRTRTQLTAIGLYEHVFCTRVDAHDPAAHDDLCTGLYRLRCQRFVERGAIDDSRAHVFGLHYHTRSVSADEPGCVQDAENAGARQLELVERVETEDARAVHGSAKPFVFLQNDHVEAGGGKIACGDQTGWPTTDDGDVARQGLQYLGPLASHVP
jgi:hypothetical protein